MTLCVDDASRRSRGAAYDVGHPLPQQAEHILRS